MAYHIESVIPDYFPDENSATLSFANVGLPTNQIISNIESFVCDKDLGDRGYQLNIASDLPVHFRNIYGERITNDRKYSPRLNENADLAIRATNSEKKVFFEIEFRPNVEKDLIKFQIGYNCGTLAAAVLILALDRDLVNSRYSTMPEFDKFVKVVTELKPQYPLLLLGISGQHI